MQRSNDPKLILKDGVYYAYLPPLTEEEFEEGIRLWMEDYRGARAHQGVRLGRRGRG